MPGCDLSGWDDSMNMSDPSRAKGDTNRCPARGQKHGIGKKTINTSPRKPEELGLAALLIDKIKDLPDVRQELCERIRRQIADGTYETERRLKIAAERLAEEILADDGQQGEADDGPD